MVNLTFRLLYHQDVAYEAVWASGPVWTLRRIEKSVAFAGIGTPDRPVQLLVAGSC